MANRQINKPAAIYSSVNICKTKSLLMHMYAFEAYLEALAHIFF